jgi:hypothetical protein
MITTVIIIIIIIIIKALSIPDGNNDFNSTDANATLRLVGATVAIVDA